MTEKLQNPGAELSPEEKRALLAQRLREKSGQAPSEYALSYGQRALWFIHQIAPQSSAYHIALTLRITSALDIAAFRRALAHLMKRHPMLRTTYHQRDDELVQVFHPDVELPFEQVDAAGWDEDTLYAQVVKAHEQPFDLENGPIARACLFTQKSDRHVLLFVVHHIAFDGYSGVILVNELFQVYEAELKGQAPALPPLTAAYTDFVRRQAETLASAEGERLKSYWLNQLSGELPTLNLPADFPRPPVQTYNGSSQQFDFDAAETARLKAFAAAEGVTLYMLMLAIFQTLLHRYSGQNDLLIGSPTTNRDSVTFANTIGYFVDPVVLRSKTDDSMTFRDFLNQTRAAVLGALGHQDYPFMLLVEQLSPRNDPSRSPLFQVMFNLQNIQRSENTLETFRDNQARTEHYAMPHEEGQFDLILDVMEAGGMVKSWLKYNTDLFAADTIARMVGHYRVLLEAVLANPTARLADLPLLTEAERQQVLVEWNATAVEYPRDKCIHDLIEAQVALTPDAVAVVFEDQQLTYDQLNRRANQLAAYLRQAGARPDAPIGLYVERSLEMVVALLGIHKAGAAYLPLDPTYPKDRVAFMLEDAQAELLITQAHLENTLSAPHARVIRIDADWPQIAQQPDANVRAEVSPENLSYIIYTSGSTGKPKGVMLEHRNVVNFFAGMDAYLRYQPSAAWLAVTSLSFDISVLEMFWTLARGFKVVIYADRSRQMQAASASSGDYSVAALITRHNVTHLQCTPSMAGMLLEDPQNHAAIGQLQQIIIGGEAFPVSLAAALRGLTQGEIINMYGPTETTIWSVAHRLTDETAIIPIGRPIANTTIYLLDQHLQPVPAGIPGELYIGGSGVGRGYLKRPELTEQRFIADPFSQQPGARLYRTGDLARYQPDGCIEFLGRIDQQVKIRGYRIEPGEIEALLDEHPTVQQAVVIVREDTPGDKYLAAYVIVRPGAAFAGADVRQYLRDHLPDYMVPAHYVTLAAFPQTPNAKIDRKALPAPEQSRPQAVPAQGIPTTEMETTLAAIWQKILLVDQVSIYDNFFDLGGHSLQTTRMVNQLQAETGIKLDPVRLRFETLGQLAVYCEGLAAEAPPAGADESGLPQKLFSSVRRFMGGKQGKHDPNLGTS